jgi:N-acetylglucosamine malate deacetylase 1
MKNSKSVLCIVAHPDDAEFQCAGTLALLAEKGWKIVIATMTPGQAGSEKIGPEEISRLRRIESVNSAAILNGSYECLEEEDIFIMYDRPTLLKAIELFRKVKPTIVFTASPSDYIIDHEVTSRIAQTACLAAAIPNVKIEGTNPNSSTPYLYYCEPMQGKNIYGNKVESDIFIDISSVIDMKERMLCCHESQRAWLSKISEADEYVIMMKEYSMMNGREINCEYAEGFRQHLGFSYPSDNILKSELRDLVHLVKG